MTRQFAFKRWSVLTLVVLLAHLGLLQSMPLSINPTSQISNSSAVFVTRTIPTEPVALPVAVQAIHTVRQRIIPKPRPAMGHVLLKNEQLAATQQTLVAVSDNTAPANQTDETTAIAGAEPAVVLAQAPVKAPPSAPTLPTAHFSAARLSASTRLIYTVKTNKFPFPLSGELLWRNLGDNYSARLRYSVLGLTRLQTSRGLISDAGLAPERFADKYRSEVAAHFNYAQGRVTFSANSPDAPLLPGAQDRLSVLVQLGALVAREPARYQAGNTVSIQTIGPRAADLWLFTVGNTETLELPGGAVPALKLERQPRELYDQKVEVWLAPQLGYLPARIRITETNGDQIDQMWTSTESADGAD